MPDLQSRVPIHMGTAKGGITYTLGENAGTEQETLSVQQIPIHNHALTASTAAGAVNNPTNQVIAASASVKLFIQDTPDSTLNANSVTPQGGSQPHENTQPFLCINFIISLYGVYPSPS